VENSFVEASMVAEGSPLPNGRGSDMPLPLPTVECAYSLRQVGLFSQFARTAVQSGAA
jgi:hypothetical protein